VGKAKPAVKNNGIGSLFSKMIYPHFR